MSSDRNLLDHGRRIAELERKVSDLYERLGQAEPLGAFDSGFSEPAGPADDPKLIELVQAGDTINAVKRWRELSGDGLKESMDAVDELSRTYRPGG